MHSGTNLFQVKIQKIEHIEGYAEKQFIKYFRAAGRQKGNTGAVLLTLLERRLDNVVYKLGFAASRAAARQVISHGHLHVNGRRVTVASYQVRVGDKLSVKDNDRSKNIIRASLEELGDPVVQNWLRLDMVKLEAEIIARPTRDDVTMPVEEQLIVEFCSQ